MRSDKKFINLILTVFCFSFLLTFTGCDVFNSPSDFVDSEDFNLSVTNQEYDLFIYSDVNQKEEFEFLCEKYEAKSGVKIKYFFVEPNQDYFSSLKSQINSEHKPAIFIVRGNSELSSLEKDGLILDLLSESESKFNTFVNSIPKDFWLTSNDFNNFGIPCSLESHGYLVNIQMVKDLVGEKKAEQFLKDFKNCSYSEFENFVINLSEYIKCSRETTVFINENSYDFSKQKSPKVSSLKGVFSPKKRDFRSFESIFFNIFDTPLKLFKSSYQQIDSLESFLFSYAQLLDFETSHSLDGENSTKRSQEFVELMFKKDQISFLEDFLNGEYFLMQGKNQDFEKIENFLNFNHEIEQLRMLPIKFPFKEEAIKLPIIKKINSSIPLFVSKYYSINSKISRKEQKLAEDFLFFLNTSDCGKNFKIEKLKEIPFNSRTKSNSPLNNSILEYQTFGLFYGVCSGLPELWHEILVESENLKNFISKKELENKDYQALSKDWIASLKNFKKTE
ncbi:MAG: hypothetical protein LBT82_02255 [Oscillospiraceae bacterium]|jgi:raffinose/stachyose/melibiose transport system substrate-binding protein|nr:hypothetical protein [Oscillospiraceae bacterium]